MPRFFFHTQDGRYVPDREGTDLANLADARMEACRVLGELVKDDPQDVLASGMFQLTVADKDRPLFVLDLRVHDPAP